MSERALRVVQVGCGAAAQDWAKQAHASAEYEQVGFVDLRREAAESTVDKLGLSRDCVYDSLAEALEATKPDVVFDVTVPEAHRDVVIAALEAGCHVLGEKPMSDTLEAAKEMVAAAQRCDRLYAITQTQRPSTEIRTLRAAVESGRLGRIDEVHMDFFIGAHFGGFRDEMHEVLLRDMSIHHFDAVRAVTGTDPRRVMCWSYNPTRSWYKGAANATAIFEMTDDVMVTYRGSWCAEGANTSWHCSWRIVGERGTLIANGSGGDVTLHILRDDAQQRFTRDTDEHVIARLEDIGAPRAIYMAEFARCIREGLTPQTHAADNIKSLAMVDAAVRSAAEGVRLDVTW